MTTVDELAQVIRQVDGNHTLGAGALAEAILEKLPHIAARQPVGQYEVQTENGPLKCSLAVYSEWQKNEEYIKRLESDLEAARQPVGEEPVAVSRMVSTAPEKIFLQIGDGDYSDEPFPHPVGEEITWCSDSIVESEVAYVRADLAAPRAHTVYLSRFRSLARWVANSAGHGINSGQRRMGEELLALIDSQAVGNK